MRKDVERAFGVLKVRFACLTKPCCYWTVERVRNMVLSCIILHNMSIWLCNEQQDPIRHEYLCSNTRILTAAEAEAESNATTIESMDSEIGEEANGNEMVRLRNALMQHQRLAIL